MRCCEAGKLSKTAVYVDSALALFVRRRRRSLIPVQMRTITILGVLALATVGAASPFGDFNGCCTAHCCAACGGSAVGHICGVNNCGRSCCECVAKACLKIDTKAVCTAAHCTWTAAGKCAVTPPPPPPPPAPRPIVPPSPAPKCASGSDPLQVSCLHPLAYVYLQQ